MTKKQALNELEFPAVDERGNTVNRPINERETLIIEKMNIYEEAWGVLRKNPELTYSEALTSLVRSRHRALADKEGEE